VAKLLVGGARAPSVTAEGLVVGTPEYMSPEQARGEALDARSDVYAMGVLLFHMMTGKVPFDSSTAFGTAFMHVNDEPTCPRLLNPRVDARLEKICLKAMRKRPEQRFATARELRGELRALLGRDDARAEQEGAPGAAPHGLLQQLEGRPRRTGLVAAGVVLLGCAVASGLWARSGPRLRPAASEPVQTATISSAVLPAPPSPVAAPPEPPVLAAAAPAPAGPSSDGAEAASARAGGDAASRAGGRGAPQVRGRGAANASVRRGGGKARASAAPSLAAEDLLLAPDLAPPPGAAAHAGPPGAPKAASPEIAPPAHVDPADAPLPVFPIPPPEPSP
jgi:serine/threonine-protein kinase